MQTSPAASSVPPPPDAIPVDPDPAISSGGGRRRAVELRQALVILAVGLLLALAVRIVLRNYVVEGESMLPTVQPGDRVLVDHLIYDVGSPRRGDVVVFHILLPGASGETNLIKRVIGLPGDTVEVRPGALLIDGRPVKEPYVQAPRAAPYSYGPATVPSGSYFVLGDNRIVSYDSHQWGFLPRQDLAGRVIASYWPPRDFHLYGL